MTLLFIYYLFSASLDKVTMYVFCTLNYYLIFLISTISFGIGIIHCFTDFLLFVLLCIYSGRLFILFCQGFNLIYGTGRHPWPSVETKVSLACLYLGKLSLFSPLLWCFLCTVTSSFWCCLLIYFCCLGNKFKLHFLSTFGLLFRCRWLTPCMYYTVTLL